MESLMSPQLKTLTISENEGADITLKEQVIFQNGQEGKRVWESGITIARYVLESKERFSGKTVLDLGSGTGIGALAALKFTQASSVVMTDYTEEILSLLKENA